MRSIAIVLLLAVFLRHGAIYWLADASGFTPAAVSYMLGGLEEMALALVISDLLLAYHATIWRNLALGACVIAFLEGAQMVIFRVLTVNIHAVPPKTNLGDHLVGFPLGHVMMAMYLVIVCYALATALRKG